MLAIYIAIYLMNANIYAIYSHQKLER